MWTRFRYRTRHRKQRDPSESEAVQPKLKVGKPGDKYEREADQVADSVMRMPDHSVQRQPAEEEEESLQMQPLEEEEEMMQMQVVEEEEEGEVIQSQPVEEEEEELMMQPLEEEEELQTKADGAEGTRGGTGPAIQRAGDGEQYAGPDIRRRLQAKEGGGEPLPKESRQEFGSKMGADFSGVRVHRDQDAAALSDQLGARAFTHGSDIYFNRGQYDTGTSGGKRLLAHELAHVVQQKGAGERVSKQGLLTPVQEQSAIHYNNRRYDLRSRMIIQNVAGSAQDGIIGPLTVEAIATFQSTNGLAVDGKVGPQTLDAMVRERVGAALQEHAIQLVVDFHNLDLSDTLTITHDPSLILTLAHTTFEPGGQRVIRLGRISFLTAGVLKAVIERELAIPAPAAVPAGPRPSHLNAAEERAAIRFNRIRYTTEKAIKGMQGLVGSVPADGIIGPDTVQRIAAYQNTHGLTVDGKAGENTLRQMVADLDGRMQQNTAIHMIMDFYNMRTFGALLDISYDHSLTTSNASTGGIIPGPSIVKIGRPGFSQGFEGLVHTIAHELEHVRQRRDGILNRDVREFLGEAVEIVSANMPEEDVAGFFNDARRALRHWNRIPAAEQRTNWARFTQVRNQVRRRHGLATPAEQVTHQPTLDGYNAVARP